MGLLNEQTTTSGSAIADKAASALSKLENSPAPESPSLQEASGGDKTQSPGGNPQESGSSKSESESDANPVYKPNTKYRALDQEWDFDQELVPAITSKEVEDKVRDLYNRAKGMDHYKTQRDGMREEYGKYKAQIEPVIGDLRKVAKYLKDGDLDSFFEMYGIDEEKILHHAIRLAELRKLPEDQRKQYLDQRGIQKRAYTLEEQNQQLQAEVHQARTMGLATQINSVLSRPEINEAIRQYDARVNRPGAFKEELAQRGDFIFSRTGQIASPEQLVQDILLRAGLSGVQALPGMDANLPSNAPQAGVVQQAVKNVIPNVAGRSASVVKQRPRSSDDLRKLAASMED